MIDKQLDQRQVIERFEAFIRGVDFPCVGAKSALSRGTLKTIVCWSIESAWDDVRIHRCERHYIVWLADVRPIIIAILHERMDFVRRLKDRLE